MQVVSLSLRKRNIMRRGVLSSYNYASRSVLVRGGKVTGVLFSRMRNDSRDGHYSCSVYYFYATSKFQLVFSFNGNECGRGLNI